MVPDFSEIWQCIAELLMLQYIFSGP